MRRRHDVVRVRATGRLNAEPPAALPRASFVTPQDVLYVRSHGDIRELDGAAHGAR